mmetsp:Transcript_14976/g.38445  ORF Transcript_14976/g.38445 Transcript_14976/m.38445 type:complete len:339 (+) Transcript_14976:1318-2334(+)
MGFAQRRHQGDGVPDGTLRQPRGPLRRRGPGQLRPSLWAAGHGGHRRGGLCRRGRHRDGGGQRAQPRPALRHHAIPRRRHHRPRPARIAGPPKAPCKRGGERRRRRRRLRRAVLCAGRRFHRGPAGDVLPRARLVPLLCAPVRAQQPGPVQADGVGEWHQFVGAVRLLPVPHPRRRQGHGRHCSAADGAQVAPGDVCARLCLRRLHRRYRGPVGDHRHEQRRALCAVGRDGRRDGLAATPGLVRGPRHAQLRRRHGGPNSGPAVARPHHLARGGGVGLGGGGGDRVAKHRDQRRARAGLRVARRRQELGQPHGGTARGDRGRREDPSWRAARRRPAGE